MSCPDSPPLPSSTHSGSTLILWVREEIDHHYERKDKKISKEGQLRTVMRSWLQRQSSTALLTQRHSVCARGGKRERELF